MSVLMSLREAAEQGYWQCRACARLGPDVIGDDVGEPHARCACCHQPGALVWHPPTLTSPECEPRPEIEPTTRQHVIPCRP